jgi:hypothetical protein
VLNYYKRLKEEKQAIEEKEQQYQQMLQHYKKVLQGRVKTTENLAEQDIITITAFYRREQRDGQSLIIYREEDNTPYYAPEYVKTIINNSESINAFINYGDNIYGLDGFKSLMSIKQDGFNKNGSKRWRTYGRINEKLKAPVLLEQLKEQKQQVENKLKEITIKDLQFVNGLKIKDSLKMETLTPDTEYTITEMCINKLTDNGKAKYFIKIENDNHIYLANEFFEKYLRNTENRLLLKFKTFAFATTPNRHKALNITATETHQK